MEIPQFKGYILEDMLAYLIRSSGYKLITKAPKNDPDLSNSGNALYLRGRGAKHQIDALGELKWIPAFNYPIRLITEAKFWDGRVDIDVIRKEVGILSDVNQNYFVTSGTKIKPRYHYTSVIFSTSGFKDSAINMAIAHQIQLADLSDREYATLGLLIDGFANNIFGDSEEINKTLFQKIRKYLRNKLEIQRSYTELGNQYSSLCNKLVSDIKNQYDTLFIAMSQGGFMLLLKAENVEHFIGHAKTKPTHDIRIHWSTIDNGNKWEIEPVNNDNLPSYKLTFKLPSKLHDWIFKASKDKFNEALNQKEVHFSKISIYYHEKEEDRDYIFNLKFNKENLIQRER